MSVLRFKALSSSINRTPLTIIPPSTKISDYFGMNVFDKDKMQKFLSKEIYKQVMEATGTGQKIDRKVAEMVAAAMKSWAIEMGATHYTHWFQQIARAHV